MSKTPLAVAAAIIEDEQGLVLIAQRPTGKPMAGYWEFPGGKIEAGESSEVALVRELKEELSLTVSVGRFMGIFHYVYESGPVDLHMYIVRAVSDPRRSEAVSVFKWINPAKIEERDMLAADHAPF